MDELLVASTQPPPPAENAPIVGYLSFNAGVFEKANLSCALFFTKPSRPYVDRMTTRETSRAGIEPSGSLARTHGAGMGLRLKTSSAFSLRVL